MMLSFLGPGQPGLEKHWATERKLKTPESVTYDAARDVLYISNINGKPTVKDGNGFISRVTLEGVIEDLHWIKGLNAPKGSGISGDRLYVTDIDELVEIDIEKGRVMKKYPVPGAIFLNDVAVDDSGSVYISDSSSKNGVIYAFEEGEIKVWLKGDEISQPNGLYAEGDKLVIGNSGDGSIKTAAFSDKKINTLAVVGSGIDGLKSDGKGNYLISDWRGKTSLVNRKGKVTELLDTTVKKINSADIEFIIDKRMLIIPTFFDDRVVAYRLLDE